MARLPVYLLIVLIFSYAVLLIPFTGHFAERSIEERLGFFPAKELVKGVASEHRQSIAALLMIKVMYYFGGAIQGRNDNSQTNADYTSMANLIRAANYLDPYNFDIYYLSQAAFPVGPNGAIFVNELIKNGMKYRTWDADIPFYAGFNAAFVLHDYPEAARFLQRASEISGNSLYASLAMKLFNKAGEVDFAISFMDAMVKSATDDNIKKLYQEKKSLLESVRVLNQSVAEYKRRFGYNPVSLQELVSSGLLLKIPRDPFGGKFYLTKDGFVDTTSGGLSVKGI